MKKVRALNHFVIFIFVFTILNTLSVFAGPSRTTYQAKIVKPDGYPLEASNVNFKFTILDPAGSCILYSETFSTVNMGSSAGLVSFSLGTGVRTFPVSGSTFEQVFSNTTASLTCDSGGPATYSPSANDTRKIVMQFNDGNGWQTLPAMTINAVPYAMYANDSLKFNGKDITAFVQVASLPTCGVSEAMRFNGVGFSCITTGGSVTSGSVITALGYTPADGASVTTLTSNVSSVSSTVASVSSTVFSVSSTVTSLQNSVAASFAAITSSQWTTSGTNIFYNTGNIGIGITTPVTKLDVSGGVRIGGENTTCAPALAGTLRYNASNVEYCNGTSWQAFGVSGAGITNFNGSTSGTQSFATGTGGTAPNFNTSNGVHTLNIPLASASSVTAGLISNTDYTTFSNKITSSAASIAQVLGYVPANDAASGTYAQKANNLSDLTNIATARTNLGLGTFATANSIDLGSASATGTLAIARLPSFTGDATIAAASNTIILSNSGITAGTYTKVTVDTKGRVTSGAQIASSDVTTALGYTPANSATTVSSQWSTSGTTINYMNGNVGIGTTAPTEKLQVSGNVLIPSGNYVKGTNVGGGLGPNIRLGNGTNETVQINGSYLDLQSQSGFNFQNSNGSRVIIDGNGNVGVGTATPSVKTHITGTNNGPLELLRLENSDAGGRQSVIGFKNSGLTNPTTKIYGGGVSAGGDGTFKVTITNPSGTEQNVIEATNSSGTDPKLIFSTAGAERMRIDNSGNIGIGTTNPAASLNVSGSGIIVEGASGASYTSGIKFNNTGYKHMSLGMRGSNFVIADTSTLGTQVWPSSVTERMVIDSSGNVGIGVTNPSAKLELASGTASLAPLKFTSGTLLSSAQSGSFEYDGFNFYVTDSTNTRRAIAANTNPGTYDNVSNINSSSNITLTPTGSVVVSSTTASTNSSTGALVVKGGLGVVGDIYTSGTIVTSSNIQGVSVTATSGMISPYIYGSTLANGNLRLESTTNNTKGYVLLASQGGNVGVGVTSTNYPLQVSGTAHIDSLRIGFSAGTNFLMSYNSTSTLSNAAWGWNLRDNFNNVDKIFVERQTDGGDIIFGNGNVGIGASNPTFRLDVAGDIGLKTNATYIHGKDTLGNNTRMLGMNSSNVLYVGDIDSRAAGVNVIATASDLNLIAQSANNVLINTSGTERVRVTAAGNVGIGTTSPLAKLQVAGHILIDGAGTDSPNFILRDATSSGTWNIDSYQGRLRVFTETSLDAGGGIERMTLTASGSVGIGTAAPTASINSTAAKVLDLSSSGVTAFNMHSTATTQETSVVTDGAGLYVDVAGHATATNNKIVFRTGATNSSYTPTARMIIDSSGNVGIGTTTPDRILHLKQNSPEMIFEENDQAADNRRWRIWSSNGQLSFQSLTDAFTGSPIPAMEIARNGNVGIGTTNPQQALHIAGNSSGSANQTGAQIGDVGSGAGPLYLIHNSPGIAGNTYFNTSWKYSGGNSKPAIVMLTNGIHFSVSNNASGTVGSAVTDLNEAMTITTTGNVGIGTTSPIYNLTVSSGNAGSYTVISNKNTAAGGQDWRWYSSSTGSSLGTDAMCFGTNVCLFTLYTTGNATLAGTLTQSSDARLKRDISSINHALDSITKIEGVTYYWKDNTKEQTKQMGLIAQNVETVFPEAVKTDTRGFKSVAYQNLVAPIINAIREIRDWMFKTDDRIHLLEIDNAKLKQRNADLEAYLCTKDPNAPICK